MNFVKSSVYQQEITSEGVKEKEIVTRTKEEIALEERLKNLPEFQRQNHFLSFAEVKYDDPSLAEKKEGFNPDVPAAVTEEEFEYYEALAAQDRRRQQQRQQEEKDMQNEFLKAKKEMEEQRRQALSEAGQYGSPRSPGGSLGRMGLSAQARRGGETSLSQGADGVSSLSSRRHATPQANATSSSMGARIFDLTSKRKLVTPAQTQRANASLTESPGESCFPSTVKRVRRNGECESDKAPTAPSGASDKDDAPVSPASGPEETPEPPVPTGGLQDLMGGYSDDEEEEEAQKEEAPKGSENGEDKAAGIAREGRKREKDAKGDKEE
ncbi:conserved hypothetical protein [Neospora caninum Liverpool]|uniref:Uncharacterized protein n=1 Tax=Neospora caninum (strain Liverpool) TaxID=572307 RepID=F0VKY0_NEOCL|nr:conserved hypothetical protein [Neospora caninum Liverpool]CBZ54732.1 conserved hypothetical protein [Neospora caninum Liverpool]CEL69447.1 TPA: hypothetical protein BN1204_051580 [Neospora caninum Liverpool]|eukprot:XP_003884760.1 conserved hypothetical protein [Neospora caninum Liverpool]